MYYIFFLINSIYITMDNHDIIEGPKEKAPLFTIIDRSYYIDRVILVPYTIGYPSYWSIYYYLMGCGIGQQLNSMMNDQLI